MLEGRTSSSLISRQGGQGHRHRGPWRFTSKRQRSGENREVPSPLRQNWKGVEAKESGGCPVVIGATSSRTIVSSEAAYSLI